MRRACLIAPVCVLAAIAAARGQDGTPLPTGEPASPGNEQPVSKRPGRDERADELARLQREVHESFGRRDFASAERALRKIVELDPDGYVGWYTLACAMGWQGKTDEGAGYLKRAIETGFCDFNLMELDPNLAPVRRTALYRSIVDAWIPILQRRIDTQVQWARGRFGTDYASMTDDRLRLGYVSGFDSGTFDQSRRDLTRVAEFWERTILGSAPSASAAEGRPDPWVLVVLPRKKDYQRWAAETFGARAETIGGVYLNEKKMLVAKDLGSTLRHEFSHAIHWRHMNRLGQQHPMWVQEGLCSLFEDVDPMPDGSIRPVPSWRTNTAKRMERVDRLIKLEELFAMSTAKFQGDRTLANYAQSRSMFLYLAQKERLGEWYARYCENFASDPTGARALEAVLNKPLDGFLKDFRAWLRELPEVPEEGRATSVRLPFGVDAGDGDGVRINSVVGGSAARDSGLRLGDVIESIDGRSVHDRIELMRILADFEPGQAVDIDYRRGKVRGRSTVTLIQPR